MGLLDSIISAESGGDPNAKNPNSSASSTFVHMIEKFRANASVGELFFAGRPTTVFRRIISVAVNAVNRVIWARALSHVGKEVIKLFPAFANLDASAAVKMEVDLAGVLAALVHAVPNSIFGGGLAASGNRNRHAVSPVYFRSPFARKTAAAFGIAGLKIVAGYNFFSPALALAKKLSHESATATANFWLGFSNNQKSAESLSYEFSTRGH